MVLYVSAVETGAAEQYVFVSSHSVTYASLPLTHEAFLFGKPFARHCSTAAAAHVFSFCPLLLPHGYRTSLDRPTVRSLDSEFYFRCTPGARPEYFPVLFCLHAAPHLLYMFARPLPSLVHPTHPSLASFLGIAGTSVFRANAGRLQQHGRVAVSMGQRAVSPRDRWRSLFRRFRWRWLIHLGRDRAVAGGGGLRRRGMHPFSYLLPLSSAKQGG